MAGSSESSQPWHRQAAIPHPVCQGRACRARPFPAPRELLWLLRVIPLSGKWWLCSSGSLAGGSPPPHRQHFPVPETTVPRPLRRQPQCQERLLLSDRRHVLPLWPPARREAGVGRKTTPEKPGRPSHGACRARRAGQAVGRCRQAGARGTGWLLWLHPTLCRLERGCVRSALCGPAALSPRLCRPEGCSHGGCWQGPHRRQRCRCRSRATVVGSRRHAQPHANPPPPPPAMGGRRGVPPCQGAAPAKVRGAARTCVPTAPRAGWRLLTLQQPGPALGGIRTASTNLSQSDFVKPVPPPSPGLCHQGDKKQKALGFSRADDTASCDTCPAGSGGGGTRQAARESWSLSPFHWGPQQWGCG